MRPSPGNQLRASLTAKFGSGSKRLGLTICPKPIKDFEKLSQLLRAYIDESKKSKADIAPEVSPDSAEYSEEVVAGRAPQRPGIDFIPSGKPGLHVFGYLNDALRAHSPDTSKMTQEEVGDALVRWWKSSRPNQAKLGYHVIFSMNPQLSLWLAEHGIPVDDVFLACMAETFLSYNNRFYPSSSLGWVAGIHHDRAHAHAHAVLYPTTSIGRPLNISGRALTRVPGRNEKIRVDYLGHILGTYYKELNRWLNETVKMTPFRDTFELQNKVVQTLSSLEVSREMTHRAGETPSLSKIINGWSDALKAPDILAKCNAALPSLERIEQQMPVGKPELDKITADLQEALAAHEKQAEELRIRRQSVRAQFEAWRNSPDAYRMVSYVPGGPVLSPSSSLSMLGYSPEQHPAPKPAQADIDRRLGVRLQRVDTQLTALVAGSPSELLVTPEVVRAQNDRCLRSLRRGAVAFNALRRKRRKPTLAYQHPAFLNLITRDLVTARETGLAFWNYCAREVAKNHHYATFEELAASFRAALARNELNGELTTLDEKTYSEAEILAGQEPEEVFVLDAPRHPANVPLMANFLERESLIATKPRSLDDIRSETRETAELIAQLSKVISLGQQVPSFSMGI